MRLFIRHGRQLLLTPEGQRVRSLAREFLGIWDSFQTALEARLGQVRRLIVAGSDVLFGQELAPLVVQFCHTHPTIPLSLRIRHNFEIEPLLTEGEIDLAILTHGAMVPSNPEIAMQSLGQRPWYLLTPTNHPLARRRRIRPQDLVRYPWILSDSPHNYWSREVRVALARFGVLDRLHVLLNVDNSMLACRYAALGLGITATPYLPDEPQRHGLHVRPLQRFFPPDHLMVWWRRGAVLRDDVQTFLQFLRQRLAQPSTRQTKAHSRPAPKSRRTV